MSNGPIVAPAWSSASFSPKTQPAPIDLPAYESIASTVGLRMPRPARSATTKAAAGGHRPVTSECGNRQHIDRITQEGERPMPMRFVREISRDGAQLVAHQLA